MKNKASKSNVFYAFAISFGRIIDLGNVANTVYSLLQLFEEYKCFYFYNMEEDPVDRLWYPVTMQSYQQIQRFNDISNGIYNDSSADVDNSRKKYKNQENSKPSKKFIKSIEKAAESKTCNQLPFPENWTTDYNTYFENTVQPNVDDAGKPGGKRIQPAEIEVFRIFSYQNISYDLDYYEVCHSLMSVLILIYNKMYDNRCLNESMYNYFEQIDKHIMDTIIAPLTSDIEEIAQIVLEDHFTDIMDKMSFEAIIKNHLIEPEFNKLIQKQ